MKKRISFLLFCSVLLAASPAITSCSPGYGCPSYNTRASVSTKGELSKQRGNSNLFPKKMRKKS